MVRPLTDKTKVYGILFCNFRAKIIIFILSPIAFFANYFCKVTATKNAIYISGNPLFELMMMEVHMVENGSINTIIEQLFRIDWSGVCYIYELIFDWSGVCYIYELIFANQGS